MARAMSQKRFQVLTSNRANRWAQIGKDFEEQVAELMVQMVVEGSIHGFTHHEPNSVEDCEGKDFTVYRLSGGELTDRSFGVTISRHSRANAMVKHPVIPQFWWRIDTKPTTMEKRILELFDKNAPGF